VNPQARDFRLSAERLTAAALEAAAGAPNDANLRHEIELAIRRECRALGLPYAPFHLEVAMGGDRKGVAFADVVHGAIIMEYSAPGSFKGGRSTAKVATAKRQAEEYAERMARDEGRSLTSYTMVVWDGLHIAFGSPSPATPAWDRIVAFDSSAAQRLLQLIGRDGRPMVHPKLLREMLGPESRIGAALIPSLFEAVVHAQEGRRSAPQTKTALLFLEWRRLFGQAVGIPTDRLQAFVRRHSETHKVHYESKIPCYLFALHTYIALVAKLVAALALPVTTQDIRDTAVSIRERVRVVEDGTIFSSAGVVNMLAGDFFSWVVDDPGWKSISEPLEDLLESLAQLSFDMTKKRPDSVRDLFKGIYEQFVPRELRHALGEIYTPDWLAEHVMDVLEWAPKHDLLDPTCGTGTFILEAVRRRLVAAEKTRTTISAEQALAGLYGFDLNPLAVLAAKASLIVVFASKLNASTPLRLPVFLADAINTSESETDGSFRHLLQTEKGVKQFRIPGSLVRSHRLHEFFDRLRDNVVAGNPQKHIVASLRPFTEGLSPSEMEMISETVSTLIEMHRENWDGIWCSILADRFAAGSIKQVSHIAGNPPWVKWSHLPPPYAEFIKPLCQDINVFSEDRYVGGIESDISTVITFQAIRKWLLPRGRLGFLITATVFFNESSQGFRRFSYPDGRPMCAVLTVEDFKDVRPFEGVTNHPALLVVEEGSATRFPVKYKVWSNPAGLGAATDAATFRKQASCIDLLAEPVAGTDAGPWLRGTKAQHSVWSHLFDGSARSAYTARKGVTTDRNGIYFLRVSRSGAEGLVHVRNDPAGAGRTGGIPIVSMDIEPDHIFPLLRGRGLRPFLLEPDPEYRILVPQRTMHGDPALMATTPNTLRFLTRFKDELERRASYRRFQRGQPFWSTWSTGPYTFSKFKVLWKEMSGGGFCAAYIGEVDDPILGCRTAVPDHKLYMVPVDTVDEASFLTGLLNAPTIATAVSAYAAALSLGTSVIEYLKIPELDVSDPLHRDICDIAQAITARSGRSDSRELSRLDELAVKILRG
jgi:N-6 DNA Methylase